jgi:hypothetical protein
MSTAISSDGPTPNPYLQTFMKTGHRPPCTHRVLRGIKLAITSKPRNAKDRSDVKAAHDWACAMSIFLKAQQAVKAAHARQTGEPSWLKARRNVNAGPQ